LQRVADFRNVPGLFRIIAVTRIADEAIAGADCKNDLREVWGQGDHALDTRRESYVSARIVSELLRG
jgi:hypothetical protein